MKNKLICLNLIGTLLFITSCSDTRIANMKNIVWKENYFNIIATSKELHERINGGPFNDFSQICIKNVKYKCSIGLSNNDFYLELYNENNIIISFYGDSHAFLIGHYESAKKANNQDYNYYFNVKLYSGQYYDYCLDYNLEFPSALTFYGYEQK